MNKLLLLTGLLVSLLLLSLPSACTYENEQDAFGTPASCDTMNMRYSVEIKAILQENCYSCHTVDNNVSGYPFEDYETLRNYAQSGLLVARINDEVKPMPQGGLMPLCLRQKIAAWVNAGAPNN